MKIIQVINSFMPDSVGGTENYVLGIAKSMIQLGHQVWIVAASKKSTSRYDYEGVKVIRFRVAEKAAPDDIKTGKAPEGLNEFISILEEIKPDIIHFNTFNRVINLWHLRAAKERGIISFFTPHESGIFCLTGTMLRPDGSICNGNVNEQNCLSCYYQGHGLGKIKSNALSWIARAVNAMGMNTLPHVPASFSLTTSRKNELAGISRHADCCIAISPWIEGTFRRNGIENVTLVAQGISSSFVNAEHSKIAPRKTGDKVRLLFVGRVYKVKALDVLCDTLDIIDKDKVEVTFACICGNDEYSREIKRRIHTLPHFNWHENVPPVQVHAMMARNDLLVLPSRSEMSPLVVLEALASRLPVLGSSIPPITDNIRDGFNGLIAQVINPGALADKLTEVIEHPEIIDRLRANITPVRTLGTVAEELVSHYSRFLTSE